jgi:eukaryotic-like serine/threonine-protein kinase
MSRPGESEIDASAPTAVTMPTVDLHVRPPAVPAALAETMVPPAASPTDATAPGGDLPSADLPGLDAVDPATYALGVEIARGGMGRVLAARDRRLRRDVAIKVLRDRGGASARFEREALITARLQHPSIVRVYDAGRLRGDPFYAMERVRGRSLERLIAATANAGDRVALLPHVIAVADALAYAHSEGVIHRDLKPANVMIGSFGETVVIDWGLAKDLRAAEGEPSLAPADPDGAADTAAASGSGGDSGSLTIAGSVMGTPAYMAPEQARGEAADERSDVYAIGALLYAVLAGAAPISETASVRTGETGIEAGRRITPLRGRVPDAPEELVSIVERAMAHAPADRHATAAELADDLRRFAAGKLVASHVYSTGELIGRWLRRHKAAVAVAAAAVVVVAVLSVIAVRGILRERDRADAARAAAQDAQRRAEDSADNLVVHQAQRALATDPSLALAWLQRLTERGLGRDAVRALAIDAAARGVGFELAGAGDDLEAIVVSADGTVAFTGADNGAVWRWDLAARTGRALGQHTGPVEALALSPDGAWLASGGTDGNIHLFALATAADRVLVGHTGTVRSIAFAPDGAAFASTGEDGTLRLWPVTGAGTPRVLVTDAHELRPLAWTADGATLWTGTGDGRALAVPVAPGAPGATGATGAVRSLALHPAELRSIALSPDGAWLATGGEDGVVQLVDTTSLRARVLGSHADVVRDLLWTPTSTAVISAGGDAIVRVYLLAGGSTDLLGNTAGVKDLAISTSGTLVAAAGIDGIARLWPITGGPPRTFFGHRGSVKALALTPDDAFLLTTSDDNTARLWPLAAPPPPGPSLLPWLSSLTNLSVSPP